MRPSLDSFTDELTLGVLGTVFAAGLVFGLAFLGDLFKIGFLNSGGGILVAAVIIMEAFFLSALVYLVFTGKL